MFPFSTLYRDTEYSLQYLASAAYNKSKRKLPVPIQNRAKELGPHLFRKSKCVPGQPRTPDPIPLVLLKTYEPAPFHSLLHYRVMYYRPEDVPCQESDNDTVSFVMLTTMPNGTVHNDTLRVPRQAFDQIIAAFTQDAVHIETEILLGNDPRLEPLLSARNLHY